MTISISEALTGRNPNRLREALQGSGKRRAETLGKFGHHPEPEIDAEVEAERLQGDLAVAHAGLLRALDYRAVTPEGLAIKDAIRSALKLSGYTGPMSERTAR